MVMIDKGVPLAEQKRQLRQRMRALRLIADQKQGPDAALGLVRVFLPAMDRFGIVAGSVVAGYWPISTEIDVRPLLARLHERGVICALPVVKDADAPLIFRRWRPTDALQEGPYGTRHPAAEAGEVVPEVLLVPLLAVDDAGHRLGHGGGYYDRTLAALRQRRPIIAIGVGFAIQRLGRVPHGEGDQRLDWLLSEDWLVQATR